MPLPRWSALLVLLFAILARSAHAQRAQQDPHIGYVFPAGGKAGTSFDVTVGGQYLKDTNAAHISGPGARVSIVKYYRPLTQGEYNNLRQKLQDTRERLLEERKKPGAKLEPLTPEKVAKEAGVTDDQLKEMEIYRKREEDPKRQPNVQISEEITLRVQVDPDAPVGDRELRLITPSGMSNPMWFYVAQWPECRETEPNDKIPDKTIGEQLPVVMNGQVLPGDVDRFAFRARAGTRLVMVTSARELIPYLADAVPGWFQATLTLYHENREVAFAGAYYFRQDPVIYYEVPQDGEYVVEIRDSIYRGREDFVYRITIGELPYITGIFPLGGRAGTQVSVELQGWNLSETQLQVDATYDRGRPLRWYNVKQSDQVTLRVPLAIDMLPETRDQESNNERDHPQEITLPMIINGRIDQAGDADWFKFESYGNLVAEVYARRMGSPVDATLRLTDANGKELASNDDNEDKGLPLLTHHADSRILADLPGPGVYYVRLADAQNKGGKDFIYRLHIRRPRPDFELRVVPSSIIARPGATVPISVHALRRDGFAEDIVLELEEPPAGFFLGGNWIPGNQDKSRLTLTVPPTPTKEPINLQLVGRSQGRERRISHPAVPAETMMQAFAYQHLVPAKDWTVFVPDGGPPPPKARLVFDRSVPARLPAGGTVRLRVLTTDKMDLKNVGVELNEPPDGISVERVLPEGDTLIVTLAADAAKVKAEQKGNLLFNAFREWKSNPTDGSPARTDRSPIGLLPAVPFEILPARPAGRQPRR
jgi:hypothetical protein